MSLKEKVIKRTKLLAFGGKHFFQSHPFKMLFIIGIISSLGFIYPHTLVKLINNRLIVSTATIPKKIISEERQAFLRKARLIDKNEPKGELMPDHINAIENFPAGSLVIPMDNNYQGKGTGSKFNLKSYGLIVHLLHANIPVKWIITTGKAKDGIDFTAMAQQVQPNTSSASSINFRSGPFIIQPGLEAQALTVIQNFNSSLSSSNKVKVYELTQSVNADVQHTLTHKPKAAILNNGGKDAIHQGYYQEAGLTQGVHYDKGLTAAQISNSSCYTFVSEPHADENYVSTSEVNNVRNFVQNGGNFLAQCAAGRAYERLGNNTNRLVTQSGVQDPGIGGNIIFDNADEPYVQIHGALADEGGSAESYKPVGGNYTAGTNIKRHAYDSQDGGNFKAYGGKAAGVTTAAGGHVFYLAGHDYKGEGNDNINGRRMYLNAFLVPAGRPTNCGLTICTNIPTNVNATIVQPSSCGVSDGAISLSASGIPPFEYSIDNGQTWQSSQTFSGLPEGLYNALVRNAGDACSAPYGNNPIQLLAPNTPNIISVASGDPTACSTNDGFINITATGIGSLQYSINNGDTWQNNGNFSGLSDGVYTILVRNNDGSCETPYMNNPVTLSSPNTASITSISSTDPTSCGANDGTIVINATAPQVNCDCDGKMKEVTVQYSGANNVTITVKKKNGSTVGTITGVNDGDVLTLKSSDYGLTNWDTKFFLRVNGNDRELHTSCSKTVAEMNGIVGGNFTVLSYIDESNNFCDGSSSSCDNCQNKMIEVTAVYNGTNNASIDIKNKNGNLLGTITGVNDGDALVLKASDYGQFNWGTKFFLEVNNSGNDREIHASCSKDLNEMNNIVGSQFDIIGYIDGSGNICSILPDLEYSIDGGTTWQSSNSFTGLSAGIYDLAIRYQGSCVVYYYGYILGEPNCPIAIDDLGAVADCGQTININVLNNDNNPQGTALTVSLLGTGSYGTFALNGNTVDYTLTADFFPGQDSVMYQICYASGECSQAAIIINGPANNILDGMVFVDANSNGINDSEAGQSNVTVRLYEDVNSDGMVDGGDVFVTSQVTAGDGSYQFNVNNVNSGTSGMTTITSSKVAFGYEGGDCWQSCSYLETSNYNNYNSHPFVEFDLSSLTLQPGCVISSAEFILTKGNTNGGGSDYQLQVKRLTNSWQEGNSCYNNCNSGVTWTSRGSAGNWTNPGGDYAAITYATMTGGDNDPTGTIYTMDITTLVNEWVNGTHPNYGLTLIPNNNNGNSWFNFYSDDVSNANVRPRLQITYTCPSGVDYVVEVDPATLGGSSLTTDNVETASFTGAGQIDCSNDFGVGNPIDPCNPVTSGNPDTDGDGIADICDLDDDNDGITDSEESNCSTYDLVSDNAGINPNVTTTSSNLVTENGETITWVSSDNHEVNAPGEDGVIGYVSGGVLCNDPTVYDITITFPEPTNTFYLLVYDFDASVFGSETLENFSILPTTVSNNGTFITTGGGQVYATSNDQNIALTWNLPTEITTLTFRLTRPNCTFEVFFDIGFLYCDTDQDGIVDSKDPDSDGDGCLDVVESGGTDTNNDGILDGTGLDSDGLIIGGTGGYDGANGNEYNAHQINITTPPSNVSANSGASENFTITASADNATSYNSGTPIYGTSGNADAGLQYQWYLGDPNSGGTALTNTGVYSGTTTATLNISDVTGLNGQYFVVVSHTNHVCNEVYSAILTVSDQCLPDANNPDTDGDGIADVCDLDDDNDGILDVNEIGDTDGDGILDRLDLDSDGDGCYDVVESGGIDSNNDGELDGNNFDADGLVVGGTGGYDGVNGNEYNAHQLTISTSPTDQIASNGNPVFFSIVASAESATSYNNGIPVYDTPGNANGSISHQWYLGDPDNGGTLLTNTGVYSGTTTGTLNISNTTGLYGNEYYVVVTESNNICEEEIRSALLYNPCSPSPTNPDTDGDGIADVCDLDDDNDGILDVNEIGDADGDRIPNSLELDSDNDGCYDVVESGGTDNDGDGILDGTGVDNDGLVTGGTGGYDGANGNEYNAHQITIITTPIDQTVKGGNSIVFNIGATAEIATSYANGVPVYGTSGNANAGIQYQWYMGNPDMGGLALTDDAIFSGTNTATLAINNTEGMNGYDFCVVITHQYHICPEVHCAMLTLTENCSNGVDDDGDNLIDCDDPECVPATPNSIIMD